MSAIGPAYFHIVQRQDDTTNSTKPTSIILTGWGYINIANTTNQGAETVTFGTTFAAAPIPVVCFAGDSVAGTTWGSNGNNIEAGMMAKFDSPTTTTMSVRLSKPGANVGGTANFFYAWHCVGEL